MMYCKDVSTKNTVTKATETLLVYITNCIDLSVGQWFFNILNVNVDYRHAKS